MFLIVIYRKIQMISPSEKPRPLPSPQKILIRLINLSAGIYARGLTKTFYYNLCLIRKSVVFCHYSMLRDMSCSFNDCRTCFVIHIVMWYSRLLPTTFMFSTQLWRWLEGIPFTLQDAGPITLSISVHVSLDLPVITAKSILMNVPQILVSMGNVLTVLTNMTVFVRMATGGTTATKRWALLEVRAGYEYSESNFVTADCDIIFTNTMYKPLIMPNDKIFGC